MVNLGPIGGDGEEVQEGDYATLAVTIKADLECGDKPREGPELEPDWDVMCAKADTVSTEVMSQITKRVPRVYVD